MANFVFAPGVKVNSRNLNLGDVDDYDFFNGSLTELRFFDDASNFTALLGNGFKFQTFGGQLIGVSEGTITGLNTLVNGVVRLTVSGWNIDAPNLATLIAQGADRDIRLLLLRGNDTVTLSNRNDFFEAGGGNDLVNGNRGNDTLVGGRGNDTLIGGRGNDVLTGGDNADSFVFDQPLGATNVDTIKDFNVAQDKIVFDLDVFTELDNPDGQLRIFYNNVTGALSYDADGAGVGSAVQFAILSAGLALTSSNFQLID